eukprot:scaffold1130_cov74-Phaeocystis_antarctica.AAC.8
MCESPANATQLNRERRQESACVLSWAFESARAHAVNAARLLRPGTRQVRGACGVAGRAVCGPRGQSAQPPKQPARATTMAGRERLVPLESSADAPRKSSAPASSAWPTVVASAGKPRSAHTPRSAQSIKQTR